MGDPTAQDVMALVYVELRRLAEHQMAHVPAGDTLQPTALVHEAYLRLQKKGESPWESRAHFFNAAARAMRDILVEQARKHARIKRGGGRRRVVLDEAEISVEHRADDLIALDEALNGLEREDPQSAEVVMLRYFAGLTVPEAAEALSTSPSSVDRRWRFARAWLRRQIEADGG